jgi:hypothetical protein
MTGWALFGALLGVGVACFALGWLARYAYRKAAEALMRKRCARENEASMEFSRKNVHDLVAPLVNMLDAAVSLVPESEWDKLFPVSITLIDPENESLGVQMDFGMPHRSASAKNGRSKKK